MRGRWLWLLLLLPLTAQAALSVRDGSGQTVTLAQPAQRIVALAPHLVETLYAIGAGPRVAAAVDYSDYPPQAAQLPRVGGYAGISVEAVLRRQPDLIVAWRDGGHARELARLRQLGVPVYISAPLRPEDVAQDMRALGVLTARDTAAAALAARFDRTLAQQRSQYAGARPISVFLQLSEQPLFSVSAHSFVGQLLSLCGARNVFADAVPPAPQVSVEAVLARRPQLVLAFSDTALSRWQAWPQLPAVASHNLLRVSEGSISRPGPRLADGVVALCRDIDQARARLPPP